jgi:hypothetical protein
MLFIYNHSYTILYYIYLSIYLFIYLFIIFYLSKDPYDFSHSLIISSSRVDHDAKVQKTLAPSDAWMLRCGAPVTSLRGVFCHEVRGL